LFILLFSTIGLHQRVSKLTVKFVTTTALHREIALRRFEREESLSHPGRFISVFLGVNPTSQALQPNTERPPRLFATTQKHE
jgi:hypothetical protein